MQIGNIREFKEQQLTKVEKRKKEDERIRKGVSQMHSLIQSSCMETLDEECKKSQERNSRVPQRENAEGKDSGNRDKKTDSKTEMEKMMSLGLRNASRILGGQSAT